MEHLGHRRGEIFHQLGGALTFKSAPDYEKPNDGDKKNDYEVTINASDGSLTSTLDVEVTVTNVNEAGAISGSASINYAENGTGTIETYAITDPEGDSVTWSVSGTDAARFSISSSRRPDIQVCAGLREAE